MNGLKKSFLEIATLIAAVHLSLLGFMAFSRMLTVGGEMTAWQHLLASQNTWDSVHYLRIAQEGYVEKFLITFFPLFPFLIQVLGFFLGGPLIASMVLNFFLHIFGVYFLYLLVCEDQVDKAWPSLIAALIFPSAFIAVVPYTESLFFFLMVGSVLCFRRERYFLAGVFGFCASLTRLPGLVLLPTFLTMAFFEKNPRPKMSHMVLPVVFPAIGFLAYLSLNFFLYDDPFVFLNEQKTKFYRNFSWPWVGFRGAFNRLFHPGAESLTLGWGELIGGVLPWLSGIYFLSKKHKGYAVFSIASAFLFTFQSFWFGNLRFCYTVFPVYIMLAAVLNRPGLRWMSFGVSLGFLGLLALQFSRGHWTF